MQARSQGYFLGVTSNPPLKLMIIQLSSNITVFCEQHSQIHSTFLACWNQITAVFRDVISSCIEHIGTIITYST